ncbi:MAG: dihydrolipoamide acetyltransferase family protein [Spirochaetia bacterium]|jgi:pyruvate dehydrogenase E2 component (dihydrolipoamide acetyltransferase)
MAHSIIMPKTGMAMEEGTVVRWLKKVGETISKGEAIAVIETDKVTMDLESDYEGTLLSIVRGDGEVVTATHTIAWVGVKGETVPAAAEAATGSPLPAAAASSPVSPTGHVADGPAPSGSAAPAADGRVPATPAARAYAAAADIALSSVAGSGPGGAVRLKDFSQARALKATPLARKVAEINSVDLVGVEGSGAGGKIRKADVVARVGTPAEARHTFASPPGASVARPAGGTSIPLTGMRRVIADKMMRSHQQVPAVTLVTRADVTDLAALRERMNAGGAQSAEYRGAQSAEYRGAQSAEYRGAQSAEYRGAQSAEYRGAAKVSYTDFILRAAAVALREHPLINSIIEGERIVLRAEINIGIAVALDAGLIVPVVRSADELGVRQIAAAVRDLADRARKGSLTPDEYAGGTFTLTNLGMYGITEFTPLINVPESAILGVGTIEESFRTGAGGVIESRKVMSLCLTHDHRHIDGAPAAAFLGRIKALLEECYSLVC